MKQLSCKKKITHGKKKFRPKITTGKIKLKFFHQLELEYFLKNPPLKKYIANKMHCKKNFKQKSLNTKKKFLKNSHRKKIFPEIIHSKKKP